MKLVRAATQANMDTLIAQIHRHGTFMSTILVTIE